MLKLICMHYITAGLKIMGVSLKNNHLLSK